MKAAHAGEKPPPGRDDAAVYRPSRWPGLIWAVPVAALGIVAWLGIGAWVGRGPTITVEFPVVGGIREDSTKIKYRGFDVGSVGSVRLSPGLDRMIVRLDFSSAMEGHLGPGTRYWISGTSLTFTDLASIKALVSGPFIGIEAKPGKTVKRARGSGSPPIVKYDPGGETVTLLSAGPLHVSPGSPVFFKDYKVGEVRGFKLRPDGEKFEIYVFIDQEWVGLLSSSSRFWDAGAVRMSNGPSGPGLQLESIPALFIGALAFETPSRPLGRPVGDGAVFSLYSSREAADEAPGPDAVVYEAVFPGGPQGLKSGAPVELESARAGSVIQVSVEYDPKAADLLTRVQFVLNPDEIERAGDSWNPRDARPQMNAMLEALVGRGLRARIGSSTPVIGGKLIELAIVEGQPRAGLIAGKPPQVPSVADGGAAQVVTQVNDVLAELKGTVAQAQGAIGQARDLLSAKGPANPQPETSSLPRTLYELSTAAQSLRELTDYLSSHPNAAIVGRKK